MHTNAVFRHFFPLSGKPYIQYTQKAKHATKNIQKRCVLEQWKLLNMQAFAKMPRIRKRDEKRIQRNRLHGVIVAKKRQWPCLQLLNLTPEVLDDLRVLWHVVIHLCDLKGPQGQSVLPPQSYRWCQNGTIWHNDYRRIDFKAPSDSVEDHALRTAFVLMFLALFAYFLQQVPLVTKDFRL